MSSVWERLSRLVSVSDCEDSDDDDDDEGERWVHTFPDTRIG